MKKNRMNASILCVAAGVLLAALSTAEAVIVLVEYVDDSGDGSGTRTQLSDGTTPTGNRFALTAFGSNPQYSLFSAASGGTRHTRWRPDFRGGQNEILAQGSRYYVPVEGADHWSVTWSNTIATNQTFYRMSNENWPDDNNTGDLGSPANGFVADDGVGLEEINWAMIVPETASLGNAHAIALGILWTDIDQDGNIDTGDAIVLKYAVSADQAAGQAAAFAEIDTPAELNAAVGNVVAPRATSFFTR